MTADQDIRDFLGAGDYRKALELLLTRYQGKVFRLACSMLGDASASEELAQDVFLRIWKALPSYRGDASLSTWIYAITRNQCLTRRKKTYTQRTVSMAEPRVLAAMEERHAARPSHLAGFDAAVLLEQLPPQYREVVTLFYLEEKSHEEVASMLGLPMGTVKTYLHRARKQLAQSVVRMP